MIRDRFLYLAGLVGSQSKPLYTTPPCESIPILAYRQTVIAYTQLVPATLPRHCVPYTHPPPLREVQWFNPNKGFGFILTDSGEELFVHFKAVQNGGRRSLRTGTKVRFDTRMSDRGEQADNVYIEQ